MRPSTYAETFASSPGRAASGICGAIAGAAVVATGATGAGASSANTDCGAGGCRGAASVIVVLHVQLGAEGGSPASSMVINEGHGMVKRPVRTLARGSARRCRSAVDRRQHSPQGERLRAWLRTPAPRHDDEHGGSLCPPTTRPPSTSGSGASGSPRTCSALMAAGIGKLPVSDTDQGLADVEERHRGRRRRRDRRRAGQGCGRGRQGRVTAAKDGAEAFQRTRQEQARGVRGTRRRPVDDVTTRLERLSRAAPRRVTWTTRSTARPRRRSSRATRARRRATSVPVTGSTARAPAAGWTGRGR